MLTDNGKGNDQNQNGQSVVTVYGEYFPHLKNSEIRGNLEKKKKNIYLVVSNKIFLVWSAISEQSRWVMQDP